MRAALRDFLVVAKLAGRMVVAEDFEVDCCAAPHVSPRNLPIGKMALYAFHSPAGWLKIGISGANSQARYTSQHYHPGSAPGTLADSLLKDPTFSHEAFCRDRPGDWIKSDCNRVNILVDARHGRPLHALLEAFLHVRLNPRYER
ncbi:MAG: hypothetical protein HND42_11285 [Armatimonadetes bacterium]|nr:hypothetical protein [Armatimonadota bacterium]